MISFSTPTAFKNAARCWAEKLPPIAVPAAVRCPAVSAGDVILFGSEPRMAPSY
jgi:hypothetical protein